MSDEKKVDEKKAEETPSVKVVKDAPRVKGLEDENKELSERLKENEYTIAERERDLAELRTANEKILASLNSAKNIPSARAGYKNMLDEINDFIWGKS